MIKKAELINKALKLFNFSDDFASRVDVFVNGQLLVSGTNANVGAGNADYYFSSAPNPCQLKFGFDLEDGDVVIVKQH